MPERHTLITAREALEILTFVSASGLYAGSRGTDILTRFPHGLWSQEECESLRDKIIADGLATRKTAAKRLKRRVTRVVPRELV